MIIYNVTIHAAASIAGEYRQWLEMEHLADMMATGMFSGYRLFRQIAAEESAGEVFMIHFHCNGVESYRKYNRVYSQQLKQKTPGRFRDYITVSRTVMELLS